MIGTLVPLFILPEFAFKFFPFAPTTEGQYILKNLVLIAAGWAVVAPHFRRVSVSTAMKTAPQAST